MKLRTNALLFASAIAAALATPAFAGFITMNGWQDANAPQGNTAQWTWNGSATAPTSSLTESLASTSDEVIHYTGSTDTDPTFHVTKTVTNNSGVAWDEYVITLSGDPSVTFGNPFAVTNVIPSTTTPIYFTTLTTATIIDFKNGVVPNLGSITFDFDINVASTGLFSFTLTQTPVNTLPEPASLALIGLGAAGLLLRKRRTA